MLTCVFKSDVKEASDRATEICKEKNLKGEDADKVQKSLLTRIKCYEPPVSANFVISKEPATNQVVYRSYSSEEELTFIED